MIDYIRDRLPEEVLLLQLTEECAELSTECNGLAKAATKMVRILDGRNPTPVTPDSAYANLVEAYDNLVEEIADVMLVLKVLDYDLDVPDYDGWMSAKLIRWAGRLKAASTTWEDKTESGLLEE